MDTTPSHQDVLCVSILTSGLLASGHFSSRKEFTNGRTGGELDEEWHNDWKAKAKDHYISTDAVSEAICLLEEIKARLTADGKALREMDRDTGDVIVANYHSIIEAVRAACIGLDNNITKQRVLARLVGKVKPNTVAACLCNLAGEGFLQENQKGRGRAHSVYSIK